MSEFTEVEVFTADEIRRSVAAYPSLFAAAGSPDASRRLLDVTVIARFWKPDITHDIPLPLEMGGPLG